MDRLGGLMRRRIGHILSVYAALFTCCGHAADYVYRDVYVLVETESAQPSEHEFRAVTGCYLRALEVAYPGAARKLRYVWVTFVDDVIDCGGVAANGCYWGDRIDVRWDPGRRGEDASLHSTAWMHEIGHAVHYLVDGTSDGGHRDKEYWHHLQRMQLECMLWDE